MSKKQEVVEAAPQVEPDWNKYYTEMATLRAENRSLVMQLGEERQRNEHMLATLINLYDRMRR